MNDLFVCETCGHIDTLEFAYPFGPVIGQPLLCTLCQTGKWHGLISRRVYDSGKDIVINAPTGLGLS